jgi:hypothetical protein
MKQLFKIDESEKRRILEMHENATKRNYLMEQGTQQNCFRTEDQTKIATMFDNKVIELCENLNNQVDEFYIGKYYLKPVDRNDSDKKNWSVYTVGETGLGTTEMGTIKLTTSTDKWFYEGFDKRNIPTVDTSLTNNVKRMSDLFTSFLPENQQFFNDGTKFKEYLVNLSKIEPEFKKTIENYINTLKTTQGGEVTYQKILTSPTITDIIS